MRRLIFKLISNRLTNWFIIRIGGENYFSSKIGYWKQYKTDPNNSDQENAGFSHAKSVQEAIDEIHNVLNRLIDKQCPSEGQILDIGCGTGLYLKEFSDRSPNYKLFGIDMSESMLERARINCPSADVKIEDIYESNFPENSFDMIYTVGAIQYFGRKRLPSIFEKLHKMLKPGGVVMISYPHATSKKDCWYSDISYLSYSPVVMDKLLSKKFDVEEHFHIARKPFVGKYDQDPHTIPGSQWNKSYVNSSIVIARKK